ncbi:MAG: DUF456 family protein [Actinomycetota bacterium]
MNWPVLIVVAATMAVGLLGVVVPFVPGLPLIWLAALVYGLIEGFDGAGVVGMVVITALLVAGIVAKVLIPSHRAVAGGAPRSSIVVAAGTGLIAFFLIPVVGLPVGAVGGLLAAEYRRLNDWQQAWQSTRIVVVGFGVGVLVEFAAGIGMIVAWMLWVAVGS